MKRLVVGIAGGSGSGKTAFAYGLQSHFPSDSLSVKLENYYKEGDQLTEQQRREQNYDDPQMLDMELLCCNLRDWKAGRAASTPTYAFSEGLEGRRSAMTEMKSKQVILVEGAQLFTHRGVRSLLDMKIYVDTQEDLRIVRRLKREVNEFGLSLDNAADLYFAHVKPMFEQYVRPSRHFADFVVVENEDLQKTTGLVAARIRSRISQ